MANSHPATLAHRRWLKLWERYGGNPDAPEAMHAKEQIAQVESGEAERRGRVFFSGMVRRG